jgi:hypothetical protein
MNNRIISETRTIIPMIFINMKIDSKAKETRALFLAFELRLAASVISIGETASGISRFSPLSVNLL